MNLLNNKWIYYSGSLLVPFGFYIALLSLILSFDIKSIEHICLPVALVLQITGLIFQLTLIYKMILRSIPMKLYEIIYQVLITIFFLPIYFFSGFIYSFYINDIILKL